MRNEIRILGTMLILTLWIGFGCGDEASKPESEPAAPVGISVSDQGSDGAPGETDAGSSDNAADSEAEQDPGGNEQDHDEPDEEVLAEGEPCDSDRVLFETELWVPMISVTCSGCHQSGSLAGNTRMVFRLDESEDAKAHNFDTAWAMAQILEEGESLLVRKPSGLALQGHGGGELTPVGSPGYLALQSFASRALGTTACTDDESVEPTDDIPLESGRRLLRRLSHTEYHHTLVSLLGQPLPGEPELASDDVIDGYTNNADALWVSPLLADQYSEHAESLAGVVLEQLSRWTSCDVVDSGTAACAREFILTFGEACFRRPLTEPELLRYFNLWYEIAFEDGYREGIRWAVTAFLQSPHFLYRPELGSFDGTHFVLDDYELASQLAYALTGTMPDSALVESARSGLLSDPTHLRGHAERLVDAPEMEAQLWRFIQAWLKLDQLETVAKSPEVYPEMTPTVRSRMLGQTQRMVASALRNQGTFSDLIAGNDTWIHSEMLSYFGIEGQVGEPDSDGYIEVSRPAHLAGGLLAEGSVLTTHAKPGSSSPIHRGVLVRERFLCQHLPPPPPNLDTSPPAMDPTKSTRERYAEHASNAACSSCHNLIDPIGFGFEAFDGIGRWRAEDGIHPVDDHGEIMGSLQTDTTFEGLGDLAQVLAGSPEVRRCFVQHWSQYLYGLHEEDALSSTIDYLAQSEGMLRDVLLGFVEAPHFSVRLGGAQAPTDVGVEQAATADTGTLLAGREEPGLGSGGGGPTGTDLEVSIVEDSRWNSGACSTVTVTNIGSDSVTWEVDIEPGGIIGSLWNGEVVSTNGGITRVRGVSWNSTLSPSESASFGFCVSF